MRSHRIIIGNVVAVRGANHGCQHSSARARRCPRDLLCVVFGLLFVLFVLFGLFFLFGLYGLFVLLRLFVLFVRARLFLLFGHLRLFLLFVFLVLLVLRVLARVPRGVPGKILGTPLFFPNGFFPNASRWTSVLQHNRPL